MKTKDKSRIAHIIAIVLCVCMVFSTLTACNLFQNQGTVEESTPAEEETTTKKAGISGKSFDVLDSEDSSEATEKNIKEPSTRETENQETPTKGNKYDNPSKETTTAQETTTKETEKQTTTSESESTSEQATHSDWPSWAQTEETTEETTTERTQQTQSTQPPETQTRHTHSYDAHSVAPTCTEGGYTVHTCSGCGDSYTDSYTSALGHNYKKYVDVEATCYQSGLVYYECSRCGANYSETTPQLSHNYVVKDIIPATCLNQGYTRYICATCGDTYNDDYTPALSPSGHTFVTQLNADGSVVRKCTVCGYIELP